MSDESNKAKRKTPPRATPPARAVRETLVIDATTFSMVVNVLNTLAAAINNELPAVARDVQELKAMAWQLADNQQQLATNQANLATDVERIAQRVGVSTVRPQAYDPDPQGYRQQPPMRLASAAPEPAPNPPSQEPLAAVLRRVQGIQQPQAAEPMRATADERMVPRR